MSISIFAKGAFQIMNLCGCNHELVVQHYVPIDMRIFIFLDLFFRNVHKHIRRAECGTAGQPNIIPKYATQV